MLQKISYLLTNYSSAIIFALFGFLGVGMAANATATVGAADADPQHAVCAGAKNLEFTSKSINNPSEAACDDEGSANAEGVNDLIAKIINILSVLVGIVAVIMIIWGGFKFITSGGDSGRVASARQTIVFALIGLVIVALAQIIVRFVLDTTTEAV